jgi:5-methylcytosine-specific restriction endonuclease McrA
MEIKVERPEEAETECFTDIAGWWNAWMPEDEIAEQAEDLEGDRKCTKCGVSKPATADYFTQDHGVLTICLTCHARASAEYRKRHHATTRAASARRYKRARSAAAGKFTPADRLALIGKHNHTCVCCDHHESACGKLIADHIIPISLGGGNHQPLCRRCNGRKGVAIIDYRPVDIGVAA